MTVERAQRVHQVKSGGDAVCTVQKVRQGYPTEDMSSVVVTARGISLTIEIASPVPGLPMNALTLALGPEDAHDLGQAITQAATELADEEARVAQP